MLHRHLCAGWADAGVGGADCARVQELDQAREHGETAVALAPKGDLESGQGVRTVGGCKQCARDSEVVQERQRQQQEVPAGECLSLKLKSMSWTQLQPPSCTPL